MPAAGKRALHPVFTPTAVAPDRLDEITVGRDPLIERLVERLRAAAETKTRAHTLVVGARGSGKTHVLAVVMHRARKAGVADRLAAAWIAEDALSISSYVDLLVEFIRALDPASLERARAYRRAKDSGGLEALLREIAAGRTLVLIVENLDRIFAAIGTAGQRALRGLVETTAEILFLASTPLLFEGVSSRHEPWYGSFDVEHLEDLSVRAGVELLHRMAIDNADLDLANFVTSSTGQSRLKAIEQLAGGSPRLWHILGGCATVETLDELVPAVESLLDELAPYYQQRLWELPPSEQKLVVELGREQPVRTVQELADATGTTNRAAATALGRLSEARWVRGVKAPGTDQRTTRYELREPLLRHHLLYRDSRTEPLSFVVEFLKSWFSQDERRRYLSAASPDSPMERHLARALLADRPGPSDEPWARRDPHDLLTAARCWKQGQPSSDRLLGSSALGTAVESVVLAALGAEPPGRPPRHKDPAVQAAVSGARRHSGAAADGLAVGLRGLLAAKLGSDDQDLVRLVSICWDDDVPTPEAGRDELGVLLQRRRDESVLTLAIRNEHAFRVAASGEFAAARDLYADLTTDRTRVLGPDHPDTLSTRKSYAASAAVAGDHAARGPYADLITGRSRALGPDHPDTLATRQWHASWTGRAGDDAAARDLYADLTVDRARVLGPDHPDTLRTRERHAYWTRLAGDPAAARERLAAITADRQRLFGATAPQTIASGVQWLRSTLDSAGSLEPLAAVLGESGFAQVASAAGESMSASDIACVLGSLHEPPNQVRLLTAFLTRRVALPPGERTAAFDLAASIVPDEVSATLRPLVSALDGDPEALAGLPQEMRSITQELIALDGSSEDDEG